MNMIYRKNRFSPKIKTSASLKLLTTSSALALASCGGGTGGGSFLVPASDSGGGLMDLSGNPAAARLSFASRIVDGYVADAQVFPDFDFDGVMDADEAAFAVRSDSEGNVTLDLPADRSYQLVSTGGTDINTGNEISTLIAAPGSAVVSPFTSMAASLANSGVTDPNAKMAELFGLDSGTDISTFDFVSEAKTGSASGKEAFAKAQQLFSTLNVISELTSSDAQTGFSDTVDFVAQQMSNSSGQFDLGDSATITALLAESDFASGETTAAITDDGKSILDVIADAVSGANLYIETSYANADWNAGTSTETTQARAAASIAQNDLLKSVSALKEGGSKEFVEQFADDFGGAAIEQRAGELALIIKDTLGDIGISDVKASVDVIDLVYDANYTNSFSIPLSSLITNDKDLVAGTNTNLTVDPTSIGVFFSDKDNTKTTSVDDDAKMTVTVDGDNLIISPSNSWVYSVDGSGNATQSGAFIGSAKFTYKVTSENGEATSYAVVNFNPPVPTISISSVSDFTDVTSALELMRTVMLLMMVQLRVQQLMLLDLCPFLLE